MRVIEISAPGGPEVLTVAERPVPAAGAGELLVKVAKAHPKVIQNPPPQATLTAPGTATQAFRLRAWIDSEDEWMRVTSDLSLAINDALAKENITLA